MPSAAVVDAFVSDFQRSCCSSSNSSSQSSSTSSLLIPSTNLINASITTNPTCYPSTTTTTTNGSSSYDINELSLHFQQQQKLSSPPLLSSTEAYTNAMNGFPIDDPLGKKSQNMTECVPVPSSEHVAEIVGRQGCKIKALRAKTNTYIKTPVRGDEPVFIITGRKEDVYVAKKEILSAAEHFSQIRAARKQQGTTSSSSNSSTSSGSNTNLHFNGLILPATKPVSSPSNSSSLSLHHMALPAQQTTIQVRVPYRVVGLVVGPKGATIKRIQQTTNTYIVTPGRDKEPVFEIAGLPENVEAAKAEIESHIAARTGHTSGNQSPVEQQQQQQHSSGSNSSFQPQPSSNNEMTEFEKQLFANDTIDLNRQCSRWMKLNNSSANSSASKFAHHLSLPFPSGTTTTTTTDSPLLFNDNHKRSTISSQPTFRTVSQSSYFPFNDNSLMYHQNSPTNTHHHHQQQPHFHHNTSSSSSSLISSFDHLDFGSSLDVIGEQTTNSSSTETNNNNMFDSVWPNFSILSMKTSSSQMGFA